MAGTADCDRLLWEIAHVMPNRVVPVQSFLTGFAEAVRSLILFTFHRAVVLILSNVRITDTAVAIRKSEWVGKRVFLGTEPCPKPSIEAHPKRAVSFFPIFDYLWNYVRHFVRLSARNQGQRVDPRDHLIMSLPPSEIPQRATPSQYQRIGKCSSRHKLPLKTPHREVGIAAGWGGVRRLAVVSDYASMAEVSYS